MTNLMFKPLSTNSGSILSFSKVISYPQGTKDILAHEMCFILDDSSTINISISARVDLSESAGLCLPSPSKSKPIFANKLPQH
jgi:hypothetical protein